MLLFIQLALFVGLVVANPVTFSDCGNKEVSTVEVAECTTNPCTLHKGKETHIIVSFKANEDSATASMKVEATVAGLLTLEIPGVDANACSNGHLTCPLKVGQTYTLKYNVTVPASAPTIEADITARLTGDGSKVLACGKIHGSIQP